MKSRVLFLLALLAGGVNVLAQNLVPNGSFEDVDECPEVLGALHLGCAEWFSSVIIPGNPINQNPSPDWFHPCSPQELLVPPETQFGFVNPQDGFAIAGFLNSWDNNENVKELIGVQLVSPLEIGHSYTVRFNLYHTDALNLEYSSNNVGVRFTTYSGYQSLEDALTNLAHLNVDTVISTKDAWLTFEFEFQADSAYQYMHIGNFFTDANTTVFRPPGTSSIGSYYFIDNVSLEEGTLSSDSYSASHLVSIYPNPTNSIICFENRINLNTKVLETCIYDRLGKVLNCWFNDSIQCIDISEYPSGVYYLKLKTNKSNVTKKIIKI